MASTPKDTERLELRLDKQLLASLKSNVKSSKSGNIQELIRNVLADFVAGKKERAVTETARESDIDLRSLLIEAHKANAEANRTIAEQARTIAAMAREGKNAAEPAAYVAPPSGSTADCPEVTPERIEHLRKRREGSAATRH